MKIAYDGKRAVMNNTGLGNYSRLLVDVLATRFPGNEYLLYTPELRKNARLDEVLRNKNVKVVTPDELASKMMPSLWRVSGITGQLKRNGIDLMHGLSGELPLTIKGSGMPSVVTMHDVIFRRFPECYSDIDRRIYDYKFRKAVHNATRVIAISESTKRDIVNDYGVAPEKVDVVYQGCSSIFRQAPSEKEINSVKEKYGITRPYVISVGTIEQRKNQIMAVRGIRGLPDELDLVLVGRRTDYAKTLDQYIRSYAMGNRVKFIENARFTDLPALYAGAFCSSYTSRYEGFGLPVIESLNSGTPVVVATGSCLEEAGGPSTPAVDPDDVEEWINVIKEMVNFPGVRAQIAREGKKYVDRFNDESMADGTMAVYRKALAGA